VTDPAERVRLGHGPVFVSRLGFGTTAIAGLLRETAAEEAEGAVAAAWQAGLRYFDTAPQYGGGEGERRLGAALAGLPRDEFVVSTKVGKVVRPGAAGEQPSQSAFVGAPPHTIAYDYSYDGTLRTLEGSLDRLRLDRIDIALVHDVNRRFHGEQVTERYDQAAGGAVRALARLRDEKVIGAFGSASNEVDIQMRFVAETDLDCLMLPARYSLLNREAAAALLPACEQRGVSVLIAAPFESGILATGARPDATFAYRAADPGVLERVARMEAVCREAGISLAAAALQFPLRHAAVASVVTGMRSAAELAENVAAMRQPIPAPVWQALEDAAGPG
jgi:D-threo-aldose 1-dehydrogenase